MFRRVSSLKWIDKCRLPESTQIYVCVSVHNVILIQNILCYLYKIHSCMAVWLDVLQEYDLEFHTLCCGIACVSVFDQCIQYYILKEITIYIFNWGNETDDWISLTLQTINVMFSRNWGEVLTKDNDWTFPIWQLPTFF